MQLFSFANVVIKSFTVLLWVIQSLTYRRVFRQGFATTGLNLDFNSISSHKQYSPAIRKNGHVFLYTWGGRSFRYNTEHDVHYHCAIPWITLITSKPYQSMGVPKATIVRVDLGQVAPTSAESTRSSQLPHIQGKPTQRRLSLIARPSELLFAFGSASVRVFA